jgi:hypothetical protein
LPRLKPKKSAMQERLSESLRKRQTLQQSSGEFLTSKMVNTRGLLQTERSAVSYEWFKPSMRTASLVTGFDDTRILGEVLAKSKGLLEIKRRLGHRSARSLAEKNGVSFDQQLKILKNKFEEEEANEPSRRFNGQTSC